MHHHRHNVTAAVVQKDISWRTADSGGNAVLIVLFTFEFISPLSRHCLKESGLQADFLCQWHKPGDRKPLPLDLVRA